MPSSEFSDSDEHSDEQLSLSESSSDESETQDTLSTMNSNKNRELKNQPFDEALEVSDSSMLSESKGSPVKKSSSQASEIKNQPYDHALELSDSGMISSPEKKPRATTTQPKNPPTTTSGNAADKPIKNKPFDETVDLSSEDDVSSVDDEKSEDEAPRSESPKAKPTPRMTRLDGPMAPITNKPPSPSKSKLASNSSEEESSSSEEDDSEDELSASAATTNGGSPTKTTAVIPEGGYKASDYESLGVSTEVKELFQYIGRFKAQDIELESRLKCFIPEYIPAVGDMDAFLKVPRPDGEEDTMGLSVVDEPALIQSDATVLDLKLRSITKKKMGDVVVRSIEDAEKNPGEVSKWIKSITELHRDKPPPQVHYSKTMPDIESLMQVWPEKVEDKLNTSLVSNIFENNGFAELDLSLEEYARVICAMCDIPVHKDLSESLHVLFSLFMEFKSNQHFTNFDHSTPIQ